MQAIQQYSLHQQVYDWLKAQIIAGAWRGKPLPAESELAQQLGVSIGTVRKALENLVRERMVVRKQGRGTFAVENASRHERCGIELLDRGRPVEPDIRVFAITEAAPSQGVAQAFGWAPNATELEKVLTVKREWWAGNAPLMLETIAVDQRRFPLFQKRLDPQKPTFFDLYAEHYRTRVQRTDWSFGAVAREASDTSAAVHVSGCADLQYQRVAFDEHDVAIEVGHYTLIAPTASCRIHQTH